MIYELIEASFEYVCKFAQLSFDTVNSTVIQGGQFARPLKAFLSWQVEF